MGASGFKNGSSRSPVRDSLRRGSDSDGIGQGEQVEGSGKTPLVGNAKYSVVPEGSEGNLENRCEQLVLIFAKVFRWGHKLRNI